MPFVIALAGKGGVGKTTICGLLIEELVRLGKAPILAVDADANSNLYEVLGTEEPVSLGDIREEMAQAELAVNSPVPPNMPKLDYADFRFSSALVEGENYDLLSMGRSQGKGCYCYVNDILRGQLSKYYKNYEYMVVDNEAGLEHISRGILPPVNIIILVSDCSRRGIQAAGRINKMVGELELPVKSCKLIVNRAPNGVLDDAVRSAVDGEGLDLAGVLPADESVYRYDADGIPLVKLPPDAPVRNALKDVIAKLGIV